MLPKHFLSRLVGKFAAAEAGVITTAGIKWFIKQYKIDMSEALQPEPEAYKTFNAFFTRALKPELRPICQASNLMAHPVDGAVSQCGSIDAHNIFQAKGHSYTTEALLGGDKNDAARFDDGDFAAIYFRLIRLPLKMCQDYLPVMNVLWLFLKPKRARWRWYWSVQQL
jgi:phosphatidylserine decarboxylase